jgi:type II secretory ATPase GspE/PulE/Tfp pilus assembly ATPase PilB-like protein
MLRIDEELRELIDRRADSIALRDHAVQSGMMTLKEAALAKLVRGATTFEEILRVTGI